MKQSLLILTILLIISSKSFCQLINIDQSITDYDVTITTQGLSEEYSTRFKDHKNKVVFVDILNQLGVPRDIAPIKLIVNYENGAGDVTVEINYNHERIFANSNYFSHNQQWRRYGFGMSVYLQSQIFTAMSQYKQSVATKASMMDQDLLKFESTIKCKKANGDFVNFYAYNYFDSRGFYPYSFYKNAHISIAGKVYETETSETQHLNDMKFFMLSKTIGLDGSKTGAYYLCKFFNIQME